MIEGALLQYLAGRHPSLKPAPKYSRIIPPPPDLHESHLRSPMPQPPITGDIVRYRGKLGFQAMRAAIVTADVDTLDPRGVESGSVPGLDGPEHVHLWVFTPGDKGGFAEYNVGPGDGPGQWSPQPKDR